MSTYTKKEREEGVPGKENSMPRAPGITRKVPAPTSSKCQSEELLDPESHGSEMDNILMSGQDQGLSQSSLDLVSGGGGGHKTSQTRWLILV